MTLIPVSLKHPLSLLPVSSGKRWSLYYTSYGQSRDAELAGFGGGSEEGEPGSEAVS